MVLWVTAIWGLVMVMRDVEADQCKGMSKAMRRMKCGKVANSVTEDSDMKGLEERVGQNFSTVVQDQYTDLPYPPFSLFDMVKEQKYYSMTPDSHSRPIFYQHTNSLNILNHYLYKVLPIVHFLHLKVSL